MPEPATLIARGLRYERAGVLDQALDCYRSAEVAAGTAAEQAESIRRQADVLRIRCDWDAAVELARRSEHVARGAGLTEHVAEAINAQAAVEQSRGDFAAARPLYERALETATEPRVRGIALQNLGVLAAMAGGHAEAARHFEASLEAFRDAGYDRGVAIALNNLGRASLDQRDFVRAEDVLTQSVAQARLIDDLELTSLALVNLAEALLERGESDAAEHNASEALGFFKSSGNLWRQVECFRLLGDVRRARDDGETARRLYRQALRTAEEIGADPEVRLLRARLQTMPDEGAAPDGGAS